MGIYEGMRLIKASEAAKQFGMRILAKPLFGALHAPDLPDNKIDPNDGSCHDYHKDYRVEDPADGTTILPDVIRFCSGEEADAFLRGLNYLRLPKEHLDLLYRTYGGGNQLRALLILIDALVSDSVSDFSRPQTTSQKIAMKILVDLRDKKALNLSERLEGWLQFREEQVKTLKDLNESADQLVIRREEIQRHEAELAAREQDLVKREAALNKPSKKKSGSKK